MTERATRSDTSASTTMTTSPTPPARPSWSRIAVAAGMVALMVRSAAADSSAYSRPSTVV
ncbi:hypothetical protein ACFQY4_41440 [Catellatospora bangladeshensis]|uniref:hypothetical protein n=1 Tax=Catellatospora bangladeshensis TaxID=310355 RepID=UPI003621A90F